MNLTIIGGGISGLIAAYVFRSQRPTLLEASPNLGGTYTAGGLKYVRETPSFRFLLDDLGIPYHIYKPAGGILLGDELKFHPEHLRTLAEPERDAIQKMHWARTRGTLDGFRSTCMNDPMGEGDASALHFDHQRFMDALASASRVFGAALLTSMAVTAIRPNPPGLRKEGGYIETAGGTHHFDRLITTIPLPLLRRLAPWMSIPETRYEMLSISVLSQVPKFLEGTWSNLDYIYTPDIFHVHRISRPIITVEPRRTWGAWQAEASASTVDVTDAMIEEATQSKVMARVHVPGHLHPLPSGLTLPENVAPLGRFAEWDTRSGAEKTLERALALKERWCG